MKIRTTPKYSENAKDFSEVEYHDDPLIALLRSKQIMEQNKNYTSVEMEVVVASVDLVRVTDENGEDSFEVNDAE